MTTWTAEPSLEPEYDENGPIPGTLTAAWDIAFGCRVNFGPAPDGTLQVSVHVSDRAQRNGVAVLATSPEQLRTLARQLETVATEQEATSGLH